MNDTLWWVIGTPIVVVLVILAVRRAIALNVAIREHLAEEAAGVKDPYAAMAAVANVQVAIDEELRRSRQAKDLMTPKKKPHANADEK